MNVDQQRKDIVSIMVIGDSLAKGVVLNDEKKRYFFSKVGFVNIIKQKIVSFVHDFSKFGTTTTYGHKLLTEKISVINPDLVLIEYGGNDCDFNWSDIAENPNKEHFPNTSIELFENNLRSMISLLKSKNAVPVLMDLPPLNAHAYFNWFTQNDTEMGNSILKWLNDIEKIYWWQEKYSFAVNKIALETKTRIVKIRNAFLAQKDYKEFICLDGIHPNEKGQSLMEQALYDYIKTHAAYMLKT